MRSKNGSLFIKTIQLIIFALLAKGFGFIREVVLANCYGAGSVSDVFVVVQNIPAVIFSIFGAAVTTGFIPLYSELKVKKGKNSAKQFTSNVISIFIVLSLAFTVIGINYSNYLVDIFAGGFSGETYGLCNQFAKIIMPSSIAIILGYVYNAFLQTEGYFNQNSLMNVPYNLIQIAFIIFGFYLGKPLLLALGILLSSFGQLLYLYIESRKKTNYRFHFECNFRDETLLQMLKLVGPVFLSTAIGQLNTIIDRSLASGLEAGSASALNYANEVTNIITQVVILSMTTIMYPKLTELFASKDGDRFNFSHRYIETISLIVVPSSVALILFSKDIVCVLFARGAFDARSVAMVSGALSVYAVGVIGVAFRDVLNKIFYSLKDTVTPMVNGSICVGLNICLNITLVGRFKYLGLAAATSISATVTILIMFFSLWRKDHALVKASVATVFVKHLSGALLSGLLLWLIGGVVGMTAGLFRLLVLGSAYFVSYLLMLLLLREKNTVGAFKHLRFMVNRLSK